jgi:hypothetical protein
LTRRGERKLQLYTIVHDFRSDPAAFAAFEADQAVSFHRPQRARQSGFGLARKARQLVE